MNNHQYYIWEPSRNRSYCILDLLPEDQPAMFRPRLGRKLGNDYPTPLSFPMSSDLYGVELPDLVRNTLGFYIVSNLLRKSLESRSEAEFEMLPIRILDRQQRLASDQYWIANLLGRQVRCANLDRSIMTELEMKKGRYTSLKKLFIQSEAVDPTFRIFRLGEIPKLFIVREDFRYELESSGATNLQFWSMGETILID